MGESIMRFVSLRVGALATVATLLTALNTFAIAGGNYGPGASDTEIKIGNTLPYSGPASAYNVIGKVQAAYFNKINAEGGINGRKITFLSYDDAYSPPKPVEQIRKRVGSDEGLLVFGSAGTASNSEDYRYLNGKKVPQLLSH